VTDRADSPLLARARLRRGRPAWPERGGNESGAAILEFSLVVLLFVSFLYALVAFGVILAKKQEITNAAADGARSAVGSATPMATAQARVEQALGAPGTKYTATYLTGACAGGGGNCITVTIDWNYAANPVVPNPPLFGKVTPDTLSAKAVVQYS
jgi:Flp pilus assembly protein TadG